MLEHSVKHKERSPVKTEAECQRITVMLVDDHLLFRESLKVMISEWTDIQIVGEAGGGEECLQLIKHCKATVAILDITMKGPEGLNLAPKIKRLSPHTEVLILTMHDNRDYIYQAFREGCRGFLLKSDSATELQKAIHTVAQGRTYLSPDITTDFIDDLIVRADNKKKQASPKNSPKAANLPTLLSTREEEVCNCLALALTTEEIASQLNISPKTVRVHIANVMRKYRIKSRTALILHLQKIQAKKK